jgi:hypothetical protein
MEKARRTIGLAIAVSGAAYAVVLIVLALWAFGGAVDAPVRSPILALIGVPLLGGTLAWTGYALMQGSAWANPASTLAAGAAAGLVLCAFTLELVWRWQHPLEQTGGPPLEIWSTMAFLAWPAAQNVLVRLFAAKKPE